jgi:hypothetical protein
VVATGDPVETGRLSQLCVLTQHARPELLMPWPVEVTHEGHSAFLRACLAALSARSDLLSVTATLR